MCPCCKSISPAFTTIYSTKHVNGVIDMKSKALAMPDKICRSTRYFKAEFAMPYIHNRLLNEG